MIGTLIHVLVGSIYGLDLIRSKAFNLFTENNQLTDDSFLTLSSGGVFYERS